jgi:hypothetical protein
MTDREPDRKSQAKRSQNRTHSAVDIFGRVFRPMVGSICVRASLTASNSLIDAQLIPKAFLPNGGVGNIKFADWRGGQH